MEYKDYEALKQKIKAWLDTHQEEYDAFVYDINSRSIKSLAHIYWLGMQITPELMGKAKREVHGDVVPSWIENDSLFLSEKETFTLINEFRNQDESAVIPCFLSWLYYGKSFETMVDRLKDVLLEHDTFKWIFKSLTRIIVSVSIKNHFREIKDWEEYIKDECNASNYVNDITKNAIEDALASLTEESVNIRHLSSEQISVLAEEASPTEVPDYTNHSAMTQITELAEKPKQSDSVSCKKKLEDYLICENDEQKKVLIKRIKNKLPLEKVGTSLAFIYAALIHLGYWDKKKYKTKNFFHQLLVNQYGKNNILCGVTNFQHFVALYFNESMEVSRKTDYVENVRHLQSLIEDLNVNNMACDDCNNINN